MSPDELTALVAEMGMPRFTAKQIAQWLYEKRATTIDEMTNLSKVNRQRLSEAYCVGRYAPAGEARSIDGTVKYLFRVTDGQMIESVYIPENDRATLCVSSQAGCKMNCRFCMTGKQGFHGSLTAAEILNQIFSIPESEKLTNIVFMGMGEPMDNYGEVMRAIAVLTGKWGLAWSPKRVTVSTIGKMAETAPPLRRERRAHRHQRPLSVPHRKALTDAGRESLSDCQSDGNAEVLRFRTPTATVRGIHHVERTERRHRPRRRIGKAPVGAESESQSHPFPRHSGRRPENVGRTTDGGIPRPPKRQRHRLHNQTLPRRGHHGRLWHAGREKP